MMERFLINWVVENGHPYYKIYDKVTDQTVHCDEDEMNETIWKMLGCNEGETNYVYVL